MDTEQSNLMGKVMGVLMTLDKSGVKKTKMGVTFLAIAGMPGIDGKCIARICGTKKRTGFAYADSLVDLGLAEKHSIPKSEVIRGRRVTGFHLTKKGAELLNK